MNNMIAVGKYHIHVFLIIIYLTINLSCQRKLIYNDSYLDNGVLPVYIVNLNK